MKMIMRRLDFNNFKISILWSRGYFGCLIGRAGDGYSYSRIRLNSRR